MSSEPVTVARPQTGSRLTTVLEEDGLPIIVLGAFAIVLIGLALRKDLIVDGWMTLVSGRWIAHHGLPTKDTLTVWTRGHRWVDQQWLAQLLFYRLWQFGGLKLALLVHALLATSGIVGAALIARLRGATPRSVAWVCLPVAFAYYPVASVMRAQSFAFPLFTLTLWLVLADARRPSRRIYFTLPLLVLWANLHGTVVLGAALVSLAGVVTIVQQRRPSARGLVLLAAPWACVFASPYARHLPGYYEQILVGGDFKQFVTEWAPTTLSPTTAPVYLLVLGGLWLLGRTGRSLPAVEQLAFVLTAVLAFEALRNTAWVGLVALAVLPQLLDRMRTPAVEPRRLNRILSATILSVLVIAVAAVATKPVSWFTSGYPTAAGGAAARAAGSGGRVFSVNDYADWLLWSQPHLTGRVAFDSRFELLSHKQTSRLVRFEPRAGNWFAATHGYKVFVLSRDTDRALARALVRRLPGRVVYRSPQVIVVRRRG